MLIEGDPQAMVTESGPKVGCAHGGVPMVGWTHGGVDPRWGAHGGVW